MPQTLGDYIPATLHLTPYTLHSSPYTQHPTPFTLHLTLFPLHPTLFPLHPSPYTPHPLKSHSRLHSLVLSLSFDFSLTHTLSLSFCHTRAISVGRDRNPINISFLVTTREQLSQQHARTCSRRRNDCGRRTAFE